ncbi:MAG: TolC family outer membrane protein [Aliishimia sp.]
MQQRVPQSIRAACSTVFLVGALIATPVTSAAETLRDALIGAYHHSGLLDQNRALLRAADEDVAQAVASLRPIINWSTSFTHSNTNFINVNGSTTNISTVGYDLNAAINASLLIWDGGRSKLGVEAAKETVLATRQQLIGIEQQVLLRAVRAYFNVRQAAETVDLRRSNLRLIAEELRAAEDRFEVGEVTRTDVAQAQARLAEGRSGVATALGDLVQAQEEYANVVGRKPAQLAVPGALPKLVSNIPEAKEIAVRNHPNLKAVQHQVMVAELGVQQAQTSAKPTISLTGQISGTRTLDSTEYVDATSLGIQLTGPIYQGGALASQTRAAIAARDAQRGSLHVVRHDIRQAVGSAYASLQSSDAQLEATGQRIRAARVAFRGVREEATLGARTTLDVLNAEQALLDAQAAQITAQANRYVAAYEVLSSLGRLTATGLRLGIQQYDPNAYYNLVKDAPRAKSEQGRKLDKVLKSLQKD